VAVRAALLPGEEINKPSYSVIPSRNR